MQCSALTVPCIYGPFCPEGVSTCPARSNTLYTDESGGLLAIEVVRWFPTVRMPLWGAAIRGRQQD